jgi:hypothetical protein
MQAPVAFYYLLAAVSAAATPSLAGNPAPLTLNYQDSDVREILPLYEQLTHLRVIHGNAVQGKITVSAVEPVRPEKSIELIERTLFANGFCIVQVADDTVEIIGQGRNPRSYGLPTLSDPKQLPAQERVVSYFFTFKHADPTKVQQLFQAYLSPPSSYVSLVCDPSSRGLWVTERTSVIRQLLVATEKIDVPPVPELSK